MLSMQSHRLQVKVVSQVNALMDSRKQFQTSEMTTKQNTRYPPIGPEPEPAPAPEPLLLSHTEIDELYAMLEVLHIVLKELKIEYTLIGGSLLGAVRSESILFNDYDIDIAIIDDGDSYKRLKMSLPKALERQAKKRNGGMTRGVMYQYQERPWVACDRVKSTAAPGISVDLFVLCKYETRQDLILALDREEIGGREQHSESHIHTSMPFESAFPLYHYDNQTAIMLKPREYFTHRELRPLRSVPFGPLTVAGPFDSIGTLERFFGKDCFTHYTDIQRPTTDDQPNTASWEECRRVPLADDQYRPLQCSPLDRRIRSNHSRRALGKTIALYREDTDPIVVSPPSSSSMFSSGMSRSQSLSIFTKGKICGALSLAVKSQDEALPQTTTGHAAADPEPTKWFGYDVRRHIGESPGTPIFSKELRAVMEHHLRKARKKREACRSPSALLVDASIAGSVGVPYTGLRDERHFLYDEHHHPLHQVLAETLGVDDLSQLHKHPIQDKQLLLAPLLTPEGRRRFHESYDHFVTSFCIPLLHSLALTKNEFHSSTSPTTAGSAVHYRYQAFPCLRVVRPGEFSIGPHCDTAYGHSIGNLNFHIPLTPVFGTNALYTESHPGKEDWHGLTTKSPGLGFLFDGARCLHFTLENTTDVTRVSIDFRIAIFRSSGDGLCAKELLVDRFSNAGPGYYDEASIASGFGSSFVVKKDGNHLLEPDARVGFPFTKK